MSVSRRNFVLGAGAGFILPAYYEKVFTFFEKRGEPLLELPKQPVRTLYAATGGEGFEFRLDTVDIEPPSTLTRREYARRYFGGEQQYIDAYEYDLDYVDFDEPEYADWIHTAWKRNDSPASKAYRLLDRLDLGPEFQGKDAVGHLDFLDCPNPYSVYLGIQTQDPISVSLVQKRLNDLHLGIAVSLIELT